MLKALIIEDEPKSKLVLQEFLKNYCQGVNIVGFSETIENAIPLIQKKRPDLIFLDIELTDGKGLDILDHFKKDEFETILVTGYDHYAIEAIKKNALDYILKPIVIKELQDAVEKAKERIKESQLIRDLNKVDLIQWNAEGKIIIKTNKDRLNVINPQDISFIEAQNQYTKWHFTNNSSLVLRYSMRKCLEILPKHFFQIHRSYIINLQKVNSVDKGRGGFIELSNTKLPVSYRKKKEMIFQLKCISSNT